MPPVKQRRERGPDALGGRGVGKMKVSGDE